MQPIKAETWNSIEKFYEKTVSVLGMYIPILEIVKHINNDPSLSKRIFAFTSHQDLIISNCSPLLRDKDALHITFELKTKKYKFAYFASPYQAPEFVRTYDSEQIIGKFDNFIKMVSW